MSETPRFDMIDAALNSAKQLIRNLGQYVPKDNAHDLVNREVMQRTMTALETAKTLNAIAQSALSAAEAELRAVREALVAFIDATANGVQGGICKMATLEGREAFYERIDNVRALAFEALASESTTTGGGEDGRDDGVS